MKTCDLALIVLNYNNAPETMKFLSRVIDVDIIEHIQVVDNASVDGSYDELRSFCEKKNLNKLTLVRSSKNEGYGRGNNYGAAELLKIIECRFFLIANPDVEFDSEAVSAMVDFLESHNECAAVAPMMLNPAGKTCLSAWSLPTVSDMFCNALRLVLPFVRNPLLYQSLHSHDDYVTVDVLPGSLFMVRTSDFKAVGGFDEDTFLYGEENLLFARFKASGRVCALLVCERYIHAHGTSITKEVSSVKRRYLMQLDSNLVYCDKVLKMPRFSKMCYATFFKLCLTVFSVMYSARILLSSHEGEEG